VKVFECLCLKIVRSYISRSLGSFPIVGGSAPSKLFFSKCLRFNNDQRKKRVL